MSFQVPLGRNVNATNVQDYAIRAYQALGANRVAAISIGNEVASANYEATAADYVADAKSVEQIVTEALNLTDGAQKIFEVLDLADNQATSKKPWTLYVQSRGSLLFICKTDKLSSSNDAFNQGLNNNSLVKYAAEHWYQTDSPDNLQGKSASLTLRLSTSALLEASADSFSITKPNSSTTQPSSPNSAPTANLSPTSRTTPPASLTSSAKPAAY